MCQCWPVLVFCRVYIPWYLQSIVSILHRLFIPSCVCSSLAHVGVLPCLYSMVFTVCRLYTTPSLHPIVCVFLPCSCWCFAVFIFHGIYSLSSLYYTVSSSHRVCVPPLLMLVFCRVYIPSYLQSIVSVLHRLFTPSCVCSSLAHVRVLPCLYSIAFTVYRLYTTPSLHPIVCVFLPCSCSCFAVFIFHRIYSLSSLYYTVSSSHRVCVPPLLMLVFCRVYIPWYLQSVVSILHRPFIPSCVCSSLAHVGVLPCLYSMVFTVYRLYTTPSLHHPIVCVFLPCSCSPCVYITEPVFDHLYAPPRLYSSYVQTHSEQELPV